MSTDIGRAINDYAERQSRLARERSRAMFGEEEPAVAQPTGNGSVAPPPPVSPSPSNVVPLATPSDPEPSLVSKLVDVKDELARGVPKAQWRGHRGLTAGGAISGLVGYMGTGKTPWQARRIRAALEGEDFLSYEALPLPEGYRFVYLTQETSATFLPALYQAGLTEAIEAGRLLVGYWHDFALDQWAEIIAAVAELLDGNGEIIVDTPAEWAQIKDEIDNVAITEGMKPLMLAASTGLSPWVNFHTPKYVNRVDDSDFDLSVIRGGGAFASNCSLVFGYKKCKPAIDDQHRFFKRLRTRFDVEGTPEFFHTRLDPDSGDLEVASPVATAIKVHMTGGDRLFELLREAGGSMKKTELREKAKMNGEDFSAAFKALESSENVRISGRPRSKKDPQVATLVD